VERTPGLTTFRQKLDGTGAGDGATTEDEIRTVEESTVEDDGTATVAEKSAGLCCTDDVVGVDAADTAELTIESFRQSSPVKTPSSMTKSSGVFVVKSSVAKR
jgi:hypothetical protein